MITHFVWVLNIYLYQEGFVDGYSHCLSSEYCVYSEGFVNAVGWIFSVAIGLCYCLLTLCRLCVLSVPKGLYWLVVCYSYSVGIYVLIWPLLICRKVKYPPIQLIHNKEIFAWCPQWSMALYTDNHTGQQCHAKSVVRFSWKATVLTMEVCYS